MPCSEDRLRRRVEASIRSAIGCSTLDEYLYFQRLSAFYHFDLFPRIRAFWFGGPMTGPRSKSLRLLRQHAGVPVQLITEDCLPLVPEFPLHPAFEFLSATHKADYMRTYLMHVHGGAYSDIKRTTGSWSRAFEEMRKDDTVWINGYPEPNETYIAFEPSIPMWKELLGNAAYICRPRTQLTHDWFCEMNALLDSRLEELRKNPARAPDDRKEWGPYPIEWNEMLGRIFHKLLPIYISHVKQMVPTFTFLDYR